MDELQRKPFADALAYCHVALLGGLLILMGFAIQNAPFIRWPFLLVGAAFIAVAVLGLLKRARSPLTDAAENWKRDDLIGLKRLGGAIAGVTLVAIPCVVFWHESVPEPAADGYLEADWIKWVFIGLLAWFSISGFAMFTVARGALSRKSPGGS